MPIHRISLKRFAWATSAVIALTLTRLPSSQSEGMLPPSTPAKNPAAHDGPLRIGENIQDSLTVTNAKGSVRTLVSFKEPLDVMVVGFFSTRCEAQDPKWTEWKHFYSDYQDWRVAFVGIQSDPADNLEDLSKAMTKAGLPFTILPDPQHKIAQSLGATYTPELVIIDEGRALRYRGPIGKEARQAIEAVIGHVDPVKTPEPTTGAPGCPLS